MFLGVGQQCAHCGKDASYVVAATEHQPLTYTCGRHLPLTITNSAASTVLVATPRKEA